MRCGDSKLKGVSPFRLKTNMDCLAGVLVVYLQTGGGSIVLVRGPRVRLRPTDRTGINRFLTFVIETNVRMVVRARYRRLVCGINCRVCGGHFLGSSIAVLCGRNVRGPFVMLNFGRSNGFAHSFPRNFFSTALTRLLRVRWCKRV